MTDISWSTAEASISGVEVPENTSPTAVILDGVIHVFYDDVSTTAADNGIWVVSSNGGSTWGAPFLIKTQAPGMNISKGTSPCPIVFQHKIYLFFNGLGNDGTFCTIFENGRWTEVFSVAKKIGGMAFYPSTSPCAAVFNGAIHLFWYGSGNNGIFSTTFDGNVWTPPFNVYDKTQGINVSNKTSPTAVVFQDSLYLFYNGLAGDGTWYTVLSQNGTWSKIVSIKAQINSMGFAISTSPSAFVIPRHKPKLCLLWTGDEASWFTYMDDDGKWRTPRQSMRLLCGQNGIREQTNAFGIVYQMIPYIFWVSPERGLRWTRGPRYEMSGSPFDLVEPLTRARSGQSFTIITADPVILTNARSQAESAGGEAVVPHIPSFLNNVVDNVNSSQVLTILIMAVGVVAPSRYRIVIEALLTPLVAINFVPEPLADTSAEPQGQRIKIQYATEREQNNGEL